MPLSRSSIFTEISSFLLVADNNSVKMVSLDVETLHSTQIPVTGPYHFSAVEYDPLSDDVYWIDSTNGTILKVSRKVSIPTQ